MNSRIVSVSFDEPSQESEIKDVIDSNVSNYEIMELLSKYNISQNITKHKEDIIGSDKKDISRMSMEEIERYERQQEISKFNTQRTNNENEINKYVDGFNVTITFE